MRAIRVAVAGIVLLVAGSLGPWADVASRDGWVTLVLAGLAAVALWRRLRLAAAGCATLALAVVLFDLLSVAGTAGVTPGWGLWTALAGALILAAGVTVGHR